MKSELGVHDVSHDVHSLWVFLLHQPVIVALVQVKDGGLLHADHGLRIGGQSKHHLQVACGEGTAPRKTP